MNEQMSMMMDNQEMMWMMVCMIATVIFAFIISICIIIQTFIQLKMLKQLCKLETHKDFK